MAEPPLLAGADQSRMTWPLPAVALLRTGAPGTVLGVAERALEASPVPAALVAVTVKEYGLPLVRPLTVQPRPAVVQVAPPGLAVAVKPVMAEPPLLAG